MACPAACQVNKRLISVKASYFFICAAIASLLPYLSVYMKQLGLSPSETAIIYGLMPFIGALVRPIIGGISDKLQRHKLVLMICCILGGVFTGSLYFVPPVDLDKYDLVLGIKVNVSCNLDTSQMHYCANRQTDITRCNIPRDDAVNTTANQSSALYSSCSLHCDLDTGEDNLICATSSQLADDLSCHSNNDTREIDLKFDFGELNWSTSPVTLSNSTLPACHSSDLSAFMMHNSSYERLYCNKISTLQCLLKCDEITNVNCDATGDHTKFSQTFWIFAIVYLIGNICFAPIFSLIDAMTYDYLGEERGKWGRQRLWGTIGFMVLGVSSGLAMDTYSGSGPEINYLFSFVGYAVFSILTGCAVCTYTISTDIACSHMLKNVRMLLRRVDILSLFLMVFVFGMFTGVIETFLFWHLQMLGGTQILLGLTMVFGCMFEVPILFLAGRIMKLIGEVNCLYVVCTAYFLRFLGYSFLKEPWLVLAIEPLHCITYGLMYSSVTAYGSRMTPEGMHGTIQGIIGGLHFGFGKGCGSLLGGALFESFGAFVTFFSQSAASVVLLLFHGSIQLYFRCRQTAEALPSEEKSSHSPKGLTKHEDGALEKLNKNGINIPVSGDLDNGDVALTQPLSASGDHV